MERRGGIGPFTHESDRVFTTWDLGLSDSTAIWFWRPVSNGVEVLDYYEANGKPLSHFFDEVEAKLEQAQARLAALEAQLQNDSSSGSAGSGMGMRLLMGLLLVGQVVTLLLLIVVLVMA